MYERPPRSPDERPSTSPKGSKPAQMKPPGARRVAVHPRQKWFLLLALLLISAATVVTLAKVSVPPSRQASQVPSGTATRSPAGTFREYPLPQSNSQIMRLTADSRGRIWFGEMGHNFLTVFDPHTAQFQHMVPPHGRYGMMATLAAPDDTIWFAEQHAN